jgi:hypothetical protein
LAVATLVDARIAFVSRSTSTTPNAAPVMLPACGRDIELIERYIDK